MDARLTKTDWLDHGLRTLARSGAGALKVVPMAAALKVSRGSFYWHFRDIADFHAELLRHWQLRMTDRIVGDLEAGVAEGQRLNQLMKRAMAADNRLDRAVRHWAAQDKSVAEAVAAVDRTRVAYITRLFAAAGVRGKRASSRAAFVYAAYLGQSALADPRLAAIPQSAIDEIAGLLKR
ncbi:MAG: TetR/AcrR family transcriptional regulator [Rhizomicrobium sp.]